MVCRHKPGDPTCTTQNPSLIQLDHKKQEVKKLEKKLEQLTGNTPDAKNYEILEVAQVGSHLVVKVKYPTCANCTFEGIKVMVYKDTSPLDAIRWRRIDPHFRPLNTKKPPTEAPAPIARFHGTDYGWKHAIAFANTILSK